MSQFKSTTLLGFIKHTPTDDLQKCYAYSLPLIYREIINWRASWPTFINGTYSHRRFSALGLPMEPAYGILKWDNSACKFQAKISIRDAPQKTLTHTKTHVPDQYIYCFQMEAAHMHNYTARSFNYSYLQQEGCLWVNSILKSWKEKERIEQIWLSIHLQ